jgi:hypothetical protein
MMQDVHVTLAQDDLKEMQGYWKFKEVALDCTLWSTGYGRGYGPVVRQTAI